jgi:quercetin dioxygenase-like cupin family protein
VTFQPGEGDRISYCLFPLLITAKVDAESAPGGRLTSAVGALRRGAEVGTHRMSDEVVYITRGRGRAFIGTDTTAVEAGSVTFVPAGTVHGFVNDADEPLEYVIVYSSSFSRAGFRALATRPGPYCPSGGPSSQDP